MFQGPNDSCNELAMNSLIHLPACLTKADVYNLAHDDLTQNGVLCYFYILSPVE